MNFKKLKESYDKSSTFSKFSFWVAVTLSIAALAYGVYTKVSTDKGSQEVIERLGELDTKLGRLTTKQVCENIGVPVIDGKLYINGCTSYYREYSFDFPGWAVGIAYLPDLRNKGVYERKYILDIGNEEDRNRVSLYQEGPDIFLRVYGDSYEDYVIKIPLEELDWKIRAIANEFNAIEFGWNGEKGDIFLYVNGKTESLQVSPFEIDMANSKLYFGSDQNSLFFGEGLFDEIYMYKYLPESITYTIGKEMSVN